MTSDPSGDYTTGYRLDDTLPGGTNRFLHVLSIDSSVEVLVDGTDRVDVRVAGGVDVGCVFAHSKIGGKIEIGGITTPLTEGVDTLPE
jgi:hypothetical protein